MFETYIFLKISLKVIKFDNKFVKSLVWWSDLSLKVKGNKKYKNLIFYTNLLIILSIDFVGGLYEVQFLKEVFE